MPVARYSVKQPRKANARQGRTPVKDARFDPTKLRSGFKLNVSKRAASARTMNAKNLNRSRKENAAESGTAFKNLISDSAKTRTMLKRERRERRAIAKASAV
jgi:hypothetical protein